MRTTLSIAFCFLAVLILNIIPYAQNIGGNTISYERGILPGLFVFSLISVSLLIGMIWLMIFKFQSALKGECMLKRKDVNVNSLYPSFFFCLFFIIVSQLDLKNISDIFNGTTLHHLIILVCFLIYFGVKKIYVQNVKPDFISFASEKIYVKDIWGNGNRKLNNLHSIHYNAKQNFIELQFQEGLDNIKLHLTDYDVTDIYNFLGALKHTKGESLIFDKDLLIGFSKLF